MQEIRRFYPFFPLVGGAVREEPQWRSLPGRCKGTWVLLGLMAPTMMRNGYGRIPKRFGPTVRPLGQPGVPATLFPKVEGTMTPITAVRANGSRSNLWASGVPVTTAVQYRRCQSRISHRPLGCRPVRKTTPPFTTYDIRAINRRVSDTAPCRT